MFIERQDLALALVLAPVIIGCAGKESTPPASSVLPTSTPVTETATPTATPPPPEPPKTPTSEPTPTPEPKPLVKLPGERGMTYIATAGLRERNNVKGGFLLTITPEGTTPEGIVVGFSTTRACGGQQTRESGAFFVNPTVTGVTTERSIKYQRPNALLDAVMLASETSFRGNLKLLAGGGCDEQELHFIAEPTAKGQGGLENSSLQVLRAIEMRPGSTTEATEILFRPCRQCQEVLNTIRAAK